ncbi:MAG: preprotein translocase subunit SecG [Patescibacteria group bacterium]|nr:preprotein translocase subunit SecG [Patescibacteria group bacterium]MBU1870876.1 preprotein translocase subunit SecG [Patescibacteria group bacterium]
MFSAKNIQIIQIIVAILLAIVILMQNRGSGLSNIFGGASNVYRTKRGIERKLFIATIILAVAFFLTSLAGIIFYKN